MWPRWPGHYFCQFENQMYASDIPRNPLQSCLVFHSILDLLLKNLFLSKLLLILLHYSIILIWSKTLLIFCFKHVSCDMQISQEMVSNAHVHQLTVSLLIHGECRVIERWCQHAMRGHMKENWLSIWLPKAVFTPILLRMLAACRVYTTNVFVYILSEGKGASGAVVRRFFFGFDCSATLFLEERSSASN